MGRQENVWIYRRIINTGRLFYVRVFLQSEIKEQDNNIKRMLSVMNNHIGYSLIDMTQIFEKLKAFDMCSYVREFTEYIYDGLNKSDIDTFSMIWNDAADKAFAGILGKRQLEIIKEAGAISTFLDKDSQIKHIQSVLCGLNEELDAVKTNAAGKMKAYIVTGISAGLILVIVLI